MCFCGIPYLCCTCGRTYIAPDRYDDRPPICVTLFCDRELAINGEFRPDTTRWSEDMGKETGLCLDCFDIMEEGVDAAMLDQDMYDVSSFEETISAQETTSVHETISVHDSNMMEEADSSDWGFDPKGSTPLATATRDRLDPPLPTFKSTVPVSINAGTDERGWGFDPEPSEMKKGEMKPPSRPQRDLQKETTEAQNRLWRARQTGNEVEIARAEVHYDEVQKDRQKRKWPSNKEFSSRKRHERRKSRLSNTLPAPSSIAEHEGSLSSMGVIEGAAASSSIVESEPPVPPPRTTQQLKDETLEAKNRLRRALLRGNPEEITAATEALEAVRANRQLRKLLRNRGESRHRRYVSSITNRSNTKTQTS